MNSYEETLQTALHVARENCPACGNPSDYCQGHGEIGDPQGFAILQEWQDYPDAWDWFVSWALDVEHYSQHTADGLKPERTKVLIGFGGPTVRLVMNHKYRRAQVEHSWDGEFPIYWPLAEEFAEYFCPHPSELS